MDSLDLLSAAALIALHVQGPHKEFRQRDVRFFGELFANWIETSGKFQTFKIHNNQIARKLSQLSKKGALKRKTKGTHPGYILTSTGLIACLQEILAIEQATDNKSVLFRIYFLSNYSDRIKGLLRSAESEMPTGLKLEINRLLDWRELAIQALRRAELDRKRLELRIEDALSMPIKVKELSIKMGWQQTVREIEKLYPYELNATKSLSALCANLPQELAKWELTEGSIKRANQLWKPLLREVNGYIEELEKLLS
ncbi:MAG: hypothetical protein KDD42_01380 [Bdellovibrionales bacterium]|nr:hypothetical protein [Bdellovibrionales bacterium]